MHDLKLMPSSNNAMRKLKVIKSVAMRAQQL